MPRIGPLFRALAAVALVAHGDPLAKLNSLRAANGLPAEIAENPAWSAGCALHMRYLELNDFAGDWHTEMPGRPGYTEAGKAAAGSAVLSNAPSLGLEPLRDGARATLTAKGHAVDRRARVTVQRLDCRCRPSKRTLTLTKSPRRIEAGGRPVRVTVSLPGFFVGEIPYRGLTLVRSLS